MNPIGSTAEKSGIIISLERSVEAFMTADLAMVANL